MKKELIKKGYVFMEEYKNMEIYFYQSGSYNLYSIYDKNKKKFVEQDIISKLNYKQKITKYLKQK